MKNLTRRPRSWRSEVGSIALLGALAVLGFWKYHVVGARAYIVQRETRLSDVKDARAKRADASLKRQDLLAAVRSLQRRFDTLKAAFEADSDNSAFIRKIESLAVASGLTIRRFTPQSAKAGPVLTEFPYKIQLAGSYHDLVAFFEAMSALGPSVDVHDVTITGRDLPFGVATAERSAAILTAHCTVSAFSLTSEQRPLNRANPSSARQPFQGDSGTSPAMVLVPRDPFANPFSSAATPSAPATREPGLRGVPVSEISLTGILRDPRGFIALLRAGDKRTFIVRPGERLHDAVVQTVTADAVTFQRTENAVTTGGSREVVKRLRASGESAGWSRR